MALKPYLLIKQEHEELENYSWCIHIFLRGTSWHVGATFGSRTFTEEYASNKVQFWAQEIRSLFARGSNHQTSHLVYHAIGHLKVQSYHWGSHLKRSSTKFWLPPYNHQIHWQQCPYRHFRQGTMEHKVYRTHHLTHGYFSPMHPVAIPLPSQQHTRSMRHQRIENTPNMFVMCSTCGSDYHSDRRQKRKQNKKVSNYAHTTYNREPQKKCMRQTGM